jgi:hypothetical protein
MDVIKHLIDHLLLKHASSTTYYLHGNGEIKSINKVLGTLLIKLVNENKIDWDEHLLIVLFWITSFNANRIHITNNQN